MAPREQIEANEKAPPSPGYLKKLENLSFEAASKALGMQSKPKAEVTAKLSSAQEAQLREIETKAIANFQGDLTLLEAALGMLRFGHHVGWRVLYIIHSKKTIRNYEEILGVKIRDLFDETGPSSHRSFGYSLAMRFPNFWKVVSGEVKIPHRQEGAK